MKKFSIVTGKKYIKQDGTQGTKWVKLGTVTQKADGSLFGELDSLPISSWFDGTINLFPIEQQQSQNNQNTSSNGNSNSYRTNQSNYNPNNYGSYQS
ncbi:hypothetical protein N5S76_11260 [Aliarcobacter cryaerophilus]|uniref:hypothetical protein n=1 Tax=Aliarcobacter cryaerophilus TaxID=28198 RepID=UPI0021B5F035|nr:hypothetical protein [Aliarcobacter cryaerophilus]MCT7500353.1 hypothetical protein [Aliarcobacter cryaerophilus]